MAPHFESADSPEIVFTIDGTDEATGERDVWCPGRGVSKRGVYVGANVVAAILDVTIEECWIFFTATGNDTEGQRMALL